MRRQLPVRVVLPRIDPDGRARFAAELDVATTLARWAAAGAPVQLRTGAPQGTAADWTGMLQRGAAHVLVVPTGRGDTDATWFAGLLGAELVGAAGLGDRLADLLPDHAPQADGGMPYQQGILPVGTATEAGVDASSPGAVAELEHLGGRGWSPARSVPLFRCPLDAERASAERRDQLVRAAASSGVTLVPVLAPEDLTLSAARMLRTSGIARIRLNGRAGAPTALRAAQVVAGSAGLAVTVQLHLTDRTGPVEVTAHQVASVVRARPDTTVLAGATHLRELAAHGALAGVLPTSTLARTVREESRRGRVARERLVEGHYADVPLVGGPHDLWWDHTDQPQEHLDWLSTLIPMGGHLHLAADHDSSGWTAPVPVSDHREITAYSSLGAQTEGALAVLATTDCVSAFLADAEAAWGGQAPRRFHGVAVAGLCAVGAPCWAAGGRRLYVDRAGVVRCRPGGPAIGTVGDTFPQLRRRLRADTGCGPTRGVPPWLPRVLSAREALRALAPTDRSARASGLGRPLLHTMGRASQWPAGLGLVRVGERYLAHHAGHGTTAELSRSQAAVLELGLDRGPDAAAVLSELRGTPVTERDVHHLVGSLLNRLTGSTSGTADIPPPPPRVATPEPQLATVDQG